MYAKAQNSQLEKEWEIRHNVKSVMLVEETRDDQLNRREIREGMATFSEELDFHDELKKRPLVKHFELDFDENDTPKGQEHSDISLYTQAAKMGLADRYNRFRVRLEQAGYSKDALDSVVLRPRADYVRETIAEYETIIAAHNDYDGYLSSQIVELKRELARLS